MPKIQYKKIKLRASSLHIVHLANQIITQYQAQGFDLTLRQLYYQFVARDLFPEDWKDKQTGSTNNIRSYKKLQGIINDARLAGLVDWDAVVDRTRFVRRLGTWGGAADILNSCVHSFRTDKWADQDERVEVWVEKDALVGVLEGVCNELEVPFLACRGYVSQSEQWGSAQRMKDIIRQGQGVVVIHLGDHDPSGIDMSRDIEDRFRMFLGQHQSGLTFERLALNMDQVTQYNPPPNPAKTTDSRYEGYIDEYGEESWELDALDPTVISDLIREAVLAHRDEDRWNDAHSAQETERGHLRSAHGHWDSVVKYLEKRKK